VANGPQTPQERWENQGGYSSATIAAEIAGLVCAADIAKANGDQASAARYLETADNWQKNVEKWTVTTNGPLADHPYYLRITKDGNPNAGTTYNVGDSGPSAADQRTVVDTSYLELVRLGVKPADDPYVVESLPVVNEQLGVTTLGASLTRGSFLVGLVVVGSDRTSTPWINQLGSGHILFESVSVSGGWVGRRAPGCDRRGSGARSVPGRSRPHPGRSDPLRSVR
jgi:hypothetical protein